MGVTTVLDGALNVVHGLRVRGELALNLMQYGRIMRRRVSDPALETVRESLAIGGIAWGLVADVDLGTDRLRWMGDARFDVGGLAAILRGKVAYARLRLRLHRALQHDVDKRLEARGGGSCGRALERAGDQDVILDGRFVSVLAWNAVWQSASAAMTPYARIDEPCFDVLVLREGISRIALIKAMLKMGRGTDDFVRETDGVEYYKCRRIAFERLEGDWLSVDGESVPVEPFYLSLAPETGHVRLLHTDRVDE
jgi:sphingosine kinase